jgi:hypothetical protein
MIHNKNAYKYYVCVFNDAINRFDYSAYQEMVILNDELGTIERGYGYTNGIIAQFA